MRSAGFVAITLLLVVAGSHPVVAGKAQEPRHLIYLHGAIVQRSQSLRPLHPQFGYYEVAEILKTFREQGFVVSGEIRPESASVSDSADRLVEQVRQLLDSGVPADRITVVGGSMGASIALVASARLGNPDLRYGVLGVCLSQIYGRLVADGGRGPSGHILTFREASDEMTSSCSPWENKPRSASSLVVREIVLETGLRHGFLFRPLPEWVNPLVEWAHGTNSE